MTAIYLVRHGQASFGEDNYDKLSELGHQQAGILGHYLKDKNIQFDRILSGSMLRHQQTARACLSNLDKAQPIEVDHRWNEYDHEQILANLDPQFETNQGVRQYLLQQPDPKQALHGLFQKAMARWQSGDFNQEYKESWLHFMHRTQQALNSVYQDQHKHVAIFTSGGPISWTICHLMGIAQQDFLRINWTLINCGVTKLVKSSQGVFVSSMNEHHGFEAHPQAKTLITYR